METNEPIIRIRNLKNSYDNTNLVLKGINLDIFPGQIIGYIGPNGAGKTTTVKILTGMLDKYSGDISVLGYNMAKNPVEVKKKIGYVPESTALYEFLTPMEYLYFLGRLYGMGAKEIQSKSEKMLRVFELYGNRNQRMVSFSRGMKQKVLIISAMIHSPTIIFLDEPLSGVDANTTIVIKEILEKLAKKGKTIFYCSHIMDVVERISHRIIIINKGQIIADGPFHELQSMNKGETLEKIFSQITANSTHSDIAGQFIDTFGDVQ